MLQKTLGMFRFGALVMRIRWKNSSMENGAGCTFGEAPESCVSSGRVASHDAAMRRPAALVSCASDG